MSASLAPRTVECSHSADRVLVPKVAKRGAAGEAEAHCTNEVRKKPKWDGLFFSRAGKW